MNSKEFEKLISKLDSIIFCLFMIMCLLGALIGVIAAK